MILATAVILMYDVFFNGTNVAWFGSYFDIAYSSIGLYNKSWQIQEGWITLEFTSMVIVGIVITATMAVMWLLEKVRQKISYFNKMDDPPFAIAKEVFASNFEKLRNWKDQGEEKPKTP